MAKTVFTVQSSMFFGATPFTLLEYDANTVADSLLLGIQLGLSRYRTLGGDRFEDQLKTLKNNFVSAMRELSTKAKAAADRSMSLDAVREKLVSVCEKWFGEVFGYDAKNGLIIGSTAAIDLERGTGDMNLVALTAGAKRLLALAEMPALAKSHFVDRAPQMSTLVRAITAGMAKASSDLIVNNQLSLANNRSMTDVDLDIAASVLEASWPFIADEFHSRLAALTAAGRLPQDLPRSLLGAASAMLASVLSGTAIKVSMLTLAAKLAKEWSASKGIEGGVLTEEIVNTRSIFHPERIKYIDAVLTQHEKLPDSQALRVTLLTAAVVRVPAAESGTNMEHVVLSVPEGVNSANIIQAAKLMLTNTAVANGAAMYAEGTISRLGTAYGGVRGGEVMEAKAELLAQVPRKTLLCPTDPVPRTMVSTVVGAFGKLPTTVADLGRRSWLFVGKHTTTEKPVANVMGELAAVDLDAMAQLAVTETTDGMKNLPAASALVEKADGSMYMAMGARTTTTAFLQLGQGAPATTNELWLLSDKLTAAKAVKPTWLVEAPETLPTHAIDTSLVQAGAFAGVARLDREVRPDLSTRMWALGNTGTDLLAWKRASASLAYVNGVSVFDMLVSAAEGKDGMEALRARVTVADGVATSTAAMASNAAAFNLNLPAAKGAKYVMLTAATSDRPAFSWTPEDVKVKVTHKSTLQVKGVIGFGSEMTVGDKITPREDWVANSITHAEEATHTAALIRNVWETFTFMHGARETPNQPKA
jgi:hypothetical protein